MKDINIFENTFQLFESPYQKAAIDCPAIAMVQFLGIHSTLLSMPNVGAVLILINVADVKAVFSNSLGLLLSSHEAHCLNAVKFSLS